MKRALIAAVFVALLAGGAIPAVAAGGQSSHGIDNPAGNPLYVIIEQVWDGNPAHAASWTVWGPRYAPELGSGPILASCPAGGAPSSCIDMSGFSFVLKGNTMQLDETYVPGVDATPQTHHVVLHDVDGDGVYTGSLSAERYVYVGSNPSGTLYHDRIDYQVTVTDGAVTAYRYLEYEHKKVK